MIWPFCPVPQFNESLIWNTIILSPFDSESRQSLGDSPRTIYSLPFAMSFRQYERAKLIVELNGTAPWSLPSWESRQRFSAAASATSISIDTTISDYRAGSYAILWKSDETYERVLIDTVNPSSLTLDAPTVNAYANGYCMPERTAYLLNGLEATRTVQPIVSASTEWGCYDGIDLSSSPYPTYRSHPIITDCPRIGSNSLSDRIEWPNEMVDSSLGVPYFDTTRGRINRQTGMGWIAKNRSELWSVNRFLHACKGRRKGFWHADWTRGIELVSTIASGSTSVTIKAIGLNVAAESGDLLIKKKSGTTHYLQYTAVAPSGSNEVLTLAGTAGFSCSPSDIGTFSRMRFMRFDHDRFEINHQHTGSGQVSTIMAQMVETPLP